MNIADYLDNNAIDYFTRKNNWRALQLLVWNWLSIAAILMAVYYWTNPLTVLLAIALLGGRQLGLAVLMHECGHHTFFSSPAVNRFVGQWLCAAPTFNDLNEFVAEHRLHHRQAGTEQDPNLANYQAYPVDRASFRRKLTRDLSGRTGIRLISYILVTALGIFNNDKRENAKPALRILWGQCLLALILTLMMSPWLYLLWLSAIITAYMVVVRIRQIAEHAVLPDLFDADPRNNSRTTLPRWWERLLIAPNFVNYHLEHHFMASVPCYNLAKLHRFLKRRGAYDNTYIYQSYGEVIDRAVVSNALAV